MSRVRGTLAANCKRSYLKCFVISGAIVPSSKDAMYTSDPNCCSRTPSKSCCYFNTLSDSAVNLTPLRPPMRTRTWVPTANGTAKFPKSGYDNFKHISMYTNSCQYKILHARWYKTRCTCATILQTGAICVPQVPRYSDIPKRGRRTALKYVYSKTIL